jgi:hypothetical protein
MLWKRERDREGERERERERQTDIFEMWVEAKK